MRRRRFLQASGAALGALALPIDALGIGLDPAKKFVFVFADGGWDPTRVFAPTLGNPLVATEPDAVVRSAGHLRWVDHPERPSVTAFMRRHHRRTLILNGVEIRSIDHDICRRLALTGDLSGTCAEWPALLSAGPTRCVSLTAGDDWDTHVDNDRRQSACFERLFARLGRLIDDLKRAPGAVEGTTLADETVVCVLSEMGRTPSLNALGGKDHWPFTSWMLVGPGITGDRVVGGFDERLRGLSVDPLSGDTMPGAPRLTARVIGATLLTIAGRDAARLLPDVAPLTGILA